MYKKKELNSHDSIRVNDYTYQSPTRNSAEMYMTGLCRYGRINCSDEKLACDEDEWNQRRELPPDDERLKNLHEGNEETHLKSQKSGKTGNGTDGTEADHVAVRGTSVLRSSGDGVGDSGGHARGTGAGDPGDGDGTGSEGQLGALGADDGCADGVVDDGGGGGGLDHGAAAGEDGDGCGGGRGGGSSG